MADGPQIGTAYVRIAADLSDVKTQAVGLFNSPEWSKIGKAAGVALAGGLAAAAVGKQLYDIGKAFDDLDDTIRTKTGATGKRLETLGGVARKVFGAMPTDLETAGSAVAGLAQRMDLSRKPLERLSKQLVALSDITESDINTNVQTSTRLFGDWSVKTSKQTETLDKLYRLTQSTGIEFSSLAELMVQFGSPLRQLGFSFDEAAVMFARFEREGVNMQTLLPGLRMALKNIAVPTDELGKQFRKLGIDTREPHDALLQIFDILSKDKIKEADQTFLASSVFGGRAWADMKAAVEEGRFEFDALIRGMNRGNETIRGAERSTRDFSEQWTLFKNRVLLVLEPVAERVFNAIGDASVELARLMKGKGSIAEALNSPLIRSTLNRIAAMFKGLAGILKDTVRGITALLRGDFGDAWDAVKGIFRSGTRAAVDVLKAWFAPIRAVVGKVADLLGDPLKAAWDKVKDVFQAGGRAVRNVMDRLGSVITEALRGIRGAFSAVLKPIRVAVQGILAIVNKALDGLGAIKDKVDDVVPDIDVPDITPWDGLSPFQRGGHINMGKPTGDSVPAMLERDEYVLNRNAVKKVGGKRVLDAINFGMAPRFATGGIVALGKQLQREGYEVGEHPAFGGVAGVHTAGSYHYRGMAIDVNDDAPPYASGSGEPGSLDRLYSRLKGMAGVVELLWRVAGHFDHLHVAMSGSGGPLPGGGRSVDLPGVRVRGSGPLAAIARGATGTVHRAAQRVLGRQGFQAGGGVIGRKIPADLQKYNRLYAKHVSPDYGGEQIPASAWAKMAEFFGMPGVSASQIVHGEANYRPGAVGDDSAAGYGNTFGYGGFQITTRASGMDSFVNSQFGGYENLLNPIANTIVAAKMYKARGFAPWFGTQFLTSENAHWSGEMGPLSRAGEGGSGGGGPKKPTKPPKSTLPLTGVIGYQHLPKKLKEALISLRKNTVVLEEQITNAETLSSMLSSEAGSELGPGEKSQQVSLYTKLLTTLIDRVANLKKGINFAPGGPRAGRLRSELEELQGKTGAGGQILQVQAALDALTGSTTGGGVDWELIASLRGEQLSTLRRELGITAAQMPVFKAFANAPVMHSGGQVPGQPGQNVPIIAEGGEWLTPNGAGIRVEVVVEDGAVDPEKIKTTVRREIEDQVRSARSGPTLGRTAVGV